MAKTLTIILPDHLEQVLTAQAQRSHKTLEEVALQVLSQHLITSSQSPPVHLDESDPLMRLVGCLNVDIPDLAENHDYYIGQSLYRDLNGDE